ncbi:AAA family ATPase [Methylomagnum sp.]
MKNAKLTALTLERFKSFKEPTRIELSPLTVILGRNNSGKSSIIQSLLLLKQTLNDPRSDVMLRLDGPMVEAFSLRELTYGWPETKGEVEGPTITIEWECDININETRAKADRPTLYGLTKYYCNANLKGSNGIENSNTLKLSLCLWTIENKAGTFVSSIQMTLHDKEVGEAPIKLVFNDNIWACYWYSDSLDKIEVKFDHFIPYLRINRRRVAKSSYQRDVHDIYMIFFAQPIEALKKLLSEFHYLGSNRQTPPSLFKPATTPPNDIGINGELAAQLLHRRQHDAVHFLPPLEVAEDSTISIPDKVCELPLVGAVNKVMQGLSINAPLRVKEIEQIGFQLMFGEASLLHVGRGLNSLLPVIELGLFADPLKFNGPFGDLSLSEYQEQCAGFSHIALEEPEAHLHPKVASRLAHWFVSLAMANRRLMVETHSDHLVRRLRGLAARAGSGSDLERWLLENVVILSVEQDENGASTVTSSRLTAQGGVEEVWPADFMDEATDEESAIYYAKLDKAEQAESTSKAEALFDVNEGEEPELDDAP